jgi:hypothetical protein
MDWSHFFTLLLSTDVPSLPDLEVLRWARRLSWGVVLASLGLWLLHRRQPRWTQRAWVGLMLVWACLPDQWGPSFWLGLAFQSPSVMTTALLLWTSLCLLWPDVVYRPNPAQRQALWRLSLVAVVLGWALLLDTFALWPISLYAWGFSPIIIMLLTLCGIAPWVIGRTPSAWGMPLVLLGSVLSVHVVLRLPTGNVWDALLDPWLWAALQVAWLPRGLRVIQRQLKGA